MSAKALVYAEQTLGVNSVYETLLAKRTELDTLFTDVANKRDLKRGIEARIEDREMDIVSNERGKHPDMSAAGMERHLKVAFAEDPSLRELREQLRQVVNDLDGLDFDVRLVETDIRIGISRLQELGGYLEYLAAVKQASYYAALGASVKEGLQDAVPTT